MIVPVPSHPKRAAAKKANREPEKVDKLRRWLTLGGAGVALTCVIELAKMEVGGFVYDESKELCRRLFLHEGLVRDLADPALNVAALQNWNLINLTFGPFRQVVVSPASDNPTLRGIRHDNDWRAALPFASALKGYLGESYVLTSESMRDIVGGFESWDKILLGGAVSHPLARAAQGYVGSGISLNWGANFPQRWYHCYNHGELHDRREVMVYHSNSTHLMGEPNWEIRDTKTGRVSFPETGTDKSGRRILSSDWLLVTKVWEGGKPLVLAGGCHGAGTASFALLLADRALLEELADEVKPHHQWQALYRVKSVEYDGQSRLCFSSPGQLKLEEVDGLSAAPVRVSWPQLIKPEPGLARASWPS